jgi:hypothetical protein
MAQKTWLKRDTIVRDLLPYKTNAVSAQAWMENTEAKKKRIEEALSCAVASLFHNRHRAQVV